MREIIIGTMLFISFQFIFTACEYLPEAENYIEIEQPDPTHMLDISLIPENDTIKIFNRTELYFQFNTYGLEMIGASISLGNDTINAYSNTLTIIISPEKYEPGVYTLIARFFTHSGTGSIADKLNREGYMIEKKYNLLIDGTDAKQIMPQYTINNDQLFELTWPVCMNYNFDAYILKKGSQIIKEFKDRNATHYVDSFYVGGSAGYEIDVRVLTNNRITYGNTLMVYEDFPHPSFELISLDSLKIHWHKQHIKSNVRLAYGVGQSTYTQRYIQYGDTSCIIPVPAFGVQHIVQLTTLPYHYNNYFNANTFVQSYYTFGTSLQMATSRIVYNKNNNILFSYSGSNKEIISLDATTKNKIKTISLPEYPLMASCGVTNDRIVFISYHNNFYVFQNENLTNPTTFKIDGLNGYGMFVLTDNNYISMKCYDKLYMIDLNNNNEISTITLPESYYATYPIVTTSQDGKYICSASVAGYRLYCFDNKQFTLVSTDTRKYTSVLFNPLNPAEIAFTFKENNLLEIRSIPDFNLVRSINLPDEQYRIENFDTSTGLLLLNNYSKLLAVNIHTGKIFKGPNCTSDSYLLYGNNIFNPYSYYADMTKWW
jgi:hypothetical protein